MGRRQHYKWRVVLEALTGMNRRSGTSYFPSISVAEKASELGRRNSEITSRQVGAILRYYESKGLVESKMVRENNCRHRIWRMVCQTE